VVRERLESALPRRSGRDRQGPINTPEPKFKLRRYHRPSAVCLGADSLISDIRNSCDAESR